MLEECKLRYHLKSLLPDQPFIVSFDNGQEIKRILLGRNMEIGFVTEKGLGSDFSIEGSPEAITDLLIGRERLSALSSSQEVKITGTYRGLLFVESILTLCRKYETEPVVV